MRVVTCLVFLGCLVAFSQGTVYNILPTDGEPGQTPFMSRLWSRLAAAQPGDEFILAAGTYSTRKNSGSEFLRTITLVGTQNSPIIVRAATGARVIITGDPSSAAGKQNAINIDGSRHFAIKGIEITGGSKGIRIINANDALFEDIYIHSIDGVGISANDYGNIYNNLTFRRIEITDTCMNDDTGEGFYLGCNDNGCALTNSVIEQCLVHDLNAPCITQGDGIEVKHGSYGNIIRNNVVYNTNYPAILVYSTNPTPFPANSFDTTRAPNVIEGNVVWNSGDYCIQATSGAVIQNNVILGACAAAGIGIVTHPQSGNPTRVQLIHNTVYNAGTLCLRGSSWSSATGMVVANNLFYCQGGQAIKYINNGAVQPSGGGNYYIGSLEGTPSSGYTAGVGASEFSNPSSLQVFPTSSASFRNGGDRTYSTPTDFNGRPRSSTNPTPGAYEYSAGGNPGWTVTTGEFKPTGSSSNPTSAPTAVPTTAPTNAPNPTTVPTTAPTATIAPVSNCGDNSITGGEECDPPSASLDCVYGDNSCQKCSSSCRNVAGNAHYCGDNVIDSDFEECDDGNEVPGDGCSATCQNEASLPRCGDNNVDPGEECDDGNNISGDGCSAICKLEVSSTCSSITPLSSSNGNFDFDTSTSTQSYSHPLCTGFGSPGIESATFFTWEATCKGVVTISTCGLSTLDTKIAAFLTTTCPPAESTILGCSDDDGCSSLQSTIQFDANVGDSILILIGAYPKSSTGPGQFSINCVPSGGNELVIYDDIWNWNDGSWASDYSTDSTDVPAFSGDVSISYAPNADASNLYDALYFRCKAPGCLTNKIYETLEFQLNGGPVGGQVLAVEFRCGSWVGYTSLTPPSIDTWSSYSLPLASLPESCDGFVIEADNDQQQGKVYIDKVVLRALPGQAPATAPSPSPVTIDTTLPSANNGEATLQPSTISSRPSEVLLITIVIKNGPVFSAAQAYTAEIRQQGYVVQSISCQIQSSSVLSCTADKYLAGDYLVRVKGNNNQVFASDFPLHVYDCTTSASCETCAAQSTCGWCSDSCKDKRDCTSGLISSPDLCPKINSQESDSSAAVFVASISTLVLLALAAFF